jgi:hypothetical protein
MSPAASEDCKIESCDAPSKDDIWMNLEERAVESDLMIAS